MLFQHPSREGEREEANTIWHQREFFNGIGGSVAALNVLSSCSDCVVVVFLRPSGGGIACCCCCEAETAHGGRKQPGREGFLPKSPLLLLCCYHWLYVVYFFFLSFQKQVLCSWEGRSKGEKLATCKCIEKPHCFHINVFKMAVVY